MKVSPLLFVGGLLCLLCPKFAAGTPLVRRAPGPPIQSELSPPTEPYIAWGRSVRGLQAGLGAPAKQVSAAFGETFHLRFYLRNRSDKTLKVVDYEPHGVWGPRVRSPKGQPIWLNIPAYDIQVHRVTRTLSPGQVLRLGEPVIQVLPVSADTHNERHKAVLQAAPGVYFVRQEHRFEEGRKEGFWTGSFSTGEVALKILPARPVQTPRGGRIEAIQAGANSKP